MPHATIVEEFPKTALSRRTGDVLAAAATGPVCLTDHGKPRFVLMTMAQFERLSGRTDGRTEDWNQGPLAGGASAFSRRDRRADVRHLIWGPGTGAGDWELSGAAIGKPALGVIRRASRPCERGRFDTKTDW
ncbi:type II toxin-antitoxin system prevent-host-death family antitoxin (plasmid) [Cereibacter sphaeroides]|nr:type II toxin-antitoxin system prevent-host-death family antitoxin [Cereibacter sphaeroides]